jgi:hypothetical protein
MEILMQEMAKNHAIDLLIEDVYTKHSDTRVRAKNLGCETEMDIIREQIIDFLTSLRQ